MIILVNNPQSYSCRNLLIDEKTGNYLKNLKQIVVHVYDLNYNLYDSSYNAALTWPTYANHSPYCCEWASAPAMCTIN